MPVFEPRPISATEVRIYREETGASMAQAKAHFLKLNRQSAYRLLMAHGTMEEKVDWLLARYAEDHGLGGEA